jgi:pimeloyl-ACP methyl ester carboxylesterase
VPRAQHERTISCPDGRQLALLDAGDPEGALVVVHNGTPSARLLYPPWIEDAAARGIRLVGYDRAGYGSSTPKPGRAVADVAADVLAIAEALGAERLATWGISGGAPHALACAALLPDRIAAAAALAGPAPFQAEGLDWFAGMGEENVVEFEAALAGREPLAAHLRGARDAMLEAGPEGIAEALRSLVSPCDEAVLTGELAAFFHASIRAGCGERLDGWLDDDLAFAADWGFELAAIEVPVLLLQGRQDRFVPVVHGEWLAAHLPGVEARFSDEDGHLTLVERRVPDVHAWLLADLR